MGLKLLSDHQYVSNTVSSIYIPDGIDGKRFLTTLRKEDNIVLASGQDELQGKIFRIGHLGFFTEADLVQVMDAIENRLLELGYRH
jgi:aspartate aminotransferase-like enzyme